MRATLRAKNILDLKAMISMISFGAWFYKLASDDILLTELESKWVVRRDLILLCFFLSFFFSVSRPSNFNGCQMLKNREC